MKSPKHPGVWVLWIALVQSAVAAMPLWIHGNNDTGWHLATRDTAKFAGLLFLVVFLASTWRRIWKISATSWLMRRRRYLGVGFAAAMGIHLICIFGIYFTQPGFIETLHPIMAIGGAIAYLFIAVMALTSTDNSVKRLGAQNWRRLHRSGIYYIWINFFFTYANGFHHSKYHAVLAVAFLLAMVFRLAVLFIPRHPAPAPQGS